MTAQTVETTAEVVPFTPTTTVAHPSFPDGQDMAQAMEMAKVLAASGLVPSALRGKPADILLILLTAREVGVGPVQALSGIHVIEGKPTMSAELMRALVMRSGHTLTIDVTDKRAVAHGKRRDTGAEATYEFTIDDATLAGLTRKTVWVQHPKAMLSARATSALCRQLFPDVIAGVSYVPEELEHVTAERADQPAQPAEADPNLTAALGEVEQETDLDALRAIYRAAAPHLCLADRARLSEALLARKAAIESDATGAADDEPAVDTAKGEIVEAELVEPEADPAEPGPVDWPPVAQPGSGRRTTRKTAQQ